MSFLKELWQWLIRGVSASSSSASDDIPTQQAPAEPAPILTERDFNHLADPQKFLEELRAMPPVIDVVEKGKQEITEELRRLAPQRSPRRRTGT